MEEPMFTVDNIETMKLVMGGEPMLLNPKNVEPFIAEHNAFVILTCNQLPWINYQNKPFTNRAHIFTLSEPISFETFISKDQFWTELSEWVTCYHLPQNGEGEMAL